MKLQASGTYLIKASAASGDFILLKAILIRSPFSSMISPPIRQRSPGPRGFKLKQTMAAGKETNRYPFRTTNADTREDIAPPDKNFPHWFSFGLSRHRRRRGVHPLSDHIQKDNMGVAGRRSHCLHHAANNGRPVNGRRTRHPDKPSVTSRPQLTVLRSVTETLQLIKTRIERVVRQIKGRTFWLDIKIIIMATASSLRLNQNAY